MRKEIIVDLVKDVVWVKEDGFEREIQLENTNPSDFEDDEIKRLVMRQLIAQHCILENINNYDVKPIIRN
ncbi:MAG: hypothetical protein ACYC8S_01350 [Minisyncoccota bacterium]